MIFGNSPQRGIPDPASLQSATGRVTWLETSKGGLSFRLNGHDPRFVYAASWGEFPRVLSHLQSAAPITVYFAQPSERGGVAVWKLVAPNVSVRSFEDIAERRRRDNYLAFPLGLLCAVGALYFFDSAWRRYEERSAA
ncbi:hypothetical protein NK553_08935 [Pseudomonas sp. ZM23]|uniref:Uncharacterized protein n=1 Tax=Pseudomonas triclosanedens TaxID=2961893 RepID=A0ABY7A005_9PSED|nr:hypothetical protein [Pseudomonas triclosanedens]MCP8464069.1 hypothetical protein [Pseudomonas triclosanedens]MCP8469153.1 hypothetical protein [Pseudomonas triclosanedens]MCP8475875.1 hypothetical protein [Pseudomonas triclosanedens]WAI50423.1 hypothetical protein OU419_03915 [Pseudomonas triclosanedens]